MKDKIQVRDLTALAEPSDNLSYHIRPLSLTVPLRFIFLRTQTISRG